MCNGGRMNLTDDERNLLMDALNALLDSGDEREDEINSLYDRLREGK